MDLKTTFLSTISYICFAFHLCNSQNVTLCVNNTAVTLHAESDTVNYIRSVNYPGDYADSDNGNCKITVLSPSNTRVRVSVIGYIKRNSGNTLRFYDGFNDHARTLNGTNSLKIDKGYTSSGRNVYVTHWSFGSTNDAFEISYKAVNQIRKKKAKEENDHAWVAGPVVFGVIGLFFVYCHVKKKWTEKRQRIEAANKNLLTQINDKDPVTIKESADTAKAKVTNMAGYDVKAHIASNIPPPYKLSEALYGIELRNVTVEYIPPSTPPPSYSRITQHSFNINENFNPSVQGYTPVLPDIESSRLPEPIDTVNLPTTVPLEFPEYIPPSETKKTEL